MGHFKNIAINREEDLLFRLENRIEREVSQGFDSLDEIKEVFLEIAQDFDISVDVVWEVYHDSDYDRVCDYDVGDLYDIEY